LAFAERLALETFTFSVIFLLIGLHIDILYRVASRLTCPDES